MNKDVKVDLYAPTRNKERIAVFLHSTGERIKGIAEHSNDPERIKINTDEGPVWVPISDVESVSGLIRLRIEGVYLGIIMPSRSGGNNRKSAT